MTSINDGKDVKSNQASGQKGKTYYIELYKSLDTQLNAECSLHARVTLLCNAWRRVHTLCQHSVPTTHPFLLAWIQRHTARTVLQTEWQSPTSKDEHTRLSEALDSFLQECRDAVSSRDGGSLPWETQLQARAEWFKGMLDNPWDHPVLKVLLDPKGEGPSTDDILKWLLEERGVVFCVRLRQLALAKCDDLALTLLTAVMDRVRSSRPPVNDCAFDEDSQQPQSDEPTFLSTLNKEAGFAESWDLLTDMEFVLLHKSQRNTRLIDLAKQTPLGNGYQLVERLINRLETNPKEKKIWKNAKDVATLIAQVMITRCMVIPQCQGSVRTVLYWCSRALVKVLPPNKLGKTTLVLAAPAGTARHLHTLATAVHAQQSAESGELKPFVVELYVRAITFGMNELEKLKLKPEYEEKEARATEQTLASWFIQFGLLLSGSERMRCECMLTAFSLHPSPKLFERIKNAPQLKTVTVDVSPKKDEPGTTENSWANDSRSMTNFVKTSETLNLKQTQNSANVLSTAIVNEGEALGLDAELCTDIIVLLSGPRVKTLSWDMEREALLENCRGYMERTQGGTRALTTELKYLNIDPAEYQHLPEEDENEDDLYYGIEKGYEHLVEFEPQPEEIWEDAVEAENTDTAESSSSEGETKRKKKSKQVINSSESDTDPLSLVAEHKKDKAEKKERPHSKERSSSNEPSSKKNDEARKDGKTRNPKKDKKERKREKKERKKKEKKEKEKPANSLSHLVGVKVTQVTLEEARGLVTDSDYDSQGKSSLQSEGNDEHVVYDGHFSMDEQSSHKNSPEYQTHLSKELDAASGHINKALCPPSKHNASHTETTSEKKKISSELKKSINRLIQFRKQKPLLPPKETSSNSTSSLSSLIGTKLQNTSNLILTKTKSDQLAMKNEVTGFSKAIYYPPKAKNKPNDNCSRTQPFLPAQGRQKPLSTQPTMDMSNLPQDPAVLDNAMNQYTQMQGQKPQAQPAQPSSQTSHLTIYQQFLQELQKNSAAGLPITKEYKTEVRPMSRVPPIIQKAKTDPAMTTSSPLAHPTPVSESAPQSAKPAPPKKVETTPSNVPNTFARLSYMKSKLNEKPKPEPNPALQYSVSEELDRRIAEMRKSKMQLLEKESNLKSGKMPPNREMPKVEVQSIEQTYVGTPSLPKEHPVLTDILRNNFGTVIKCTNAESQKVQAEVHTYANKPKQSSLTEKDQQDISKLLGQKSIMDSYHTQPTISSQGSTTVDTQVLNNTLPQTGHTDLSNKSNPELSKPVQVIKSPSTAKIQQKQAQNSKEMIEIRARLPINVTGTDFHFPVISNTTILRTTAMIQDNKVCPAPSTQPKQIKAKAKRKSAQNLIPIPNPANVIEVNKAVSKKYVPKPPIPIPKFDVDKKEQDWTQVMDALRSQKTVRAPDALDMTTNKAACKNPDVKNVPVKTDLDLKIESIIASIMKQQALEHGKNTPNILRQPPMQSTGAAPEAMQKQSKYPAFQNKPAQMKTKILNMPTPVTSYPIEEPKRHLQPELIKEDPFISGNQNDDYDILDGLLDDDLRQEIGEILLEEDNCSASNISATETEHDLSKNKHLMNSNVQAQPQLTINKGFIDSAHKAAQPNKQIPAAVPLTPKGNLKRAPQKEKLRIISNEKVDIRDLADNILPVIRKAPAAVVNKAQDVTIQNFKSSKQTVSNTKTATVLKPTNVVYSETPQLSRPNMVIYDPFGVSKSNQNFVSVANTSKLVYQPYQIIQSTLIIPTVDTQQAPVNVTFNAVPTTVAVQIPQVAVSERASISGEIRSLPVSKPNQNIIKPANEQPIQDCAVSKTNTMNNVTVVPKTKSCIPQSKGQKVVVKAKATKKEVPAKAEQKASMKPKVTLIENVAPSISSDQVTAKESPIRADKPTEIVSPDEPLSEKDLVESNKMTDDIRIHKKRQAIINRQIHCHLYYPPIPLGYASLAVENHGFDEHEPKFSKISGQSEPIEVKESVQNKDEKEDKAVCRRILLRSSNTISGVAKQDDNLGRKTKVRLKDPDRKETQTNEIPDPETKSASEIMSTKSTNAVNDDNSTNVVSKIKEHEDVKIEARTAASSGSTQTCAPSRVSKRILNKKIKKTEKGEAKTQREKCIEDDLIQNKNIKKLQDNNIIVTKMRASAVPNAEDTTLDVEATLPGVKILKTKVHDDNSMKADDKLEAPKENTVTECPKIVQATKNKNQKNKKPLADISTVNKNVPVPKEMANTNIDTIEILSSPEINLSDENPMTKATTICNKNEDTAHTHLKHATGNIAVENLAQNRLDVKEAECSPALGEMKSVDHELNLKREIVSTQAQSATVTKQVELSDIPHSGAALLRDEVTSVITPIGQKLSTNSKLIRLVDDIESALSAITETAVSSPIIETPIDKELNATPATEQGIIEDTPEKPKTDLKLMENSKDNKTMHPTETVQCDKGLDPKNPYGNIIAEPVFIKGKEEDNTKNARDVDATLASNCPIDRDIKRTSPEATSVEHAKIIHNENTILASEDNSKSLETKSSAADTQSVRQETYCKDFIKPSEEKPQGNQTTKNASVLDEDHKKNLEKNVGETIALSDDSEIDSSTETDKEAIDKSADLNRFTPKDIPQSYKDSIQIVEVPIPGNTNPFKRCVKIKLPNNRMFKATVHGKISVSFDSLFEEPILKNILLSDLHNKKKYTLSVQVPPNKNETEPQTIETVNLISDDEDEPELPLQQLMTTSGPYKIRHVDNDMFKKHQEIFIKKCSIKLQRCDEKPKSEMKESLVEALLKDLVPSLVNNSEVIEIPDSDSENESQEIPEIDALKNMLLQDLGVVDNSQREKNLENNLPANAILVENKRLSRSRKSVYHRNREPVTLIIPEKRSSSLTKRSKSVNSNKSHNSNEEEHRPDYSHIIKRKCYIELERCDNMVKKLKNQLKVSEQGCLLDNADDNACNDDTSRTLSRSGSFSLLNDLEELNVPVVKVIAGFSQVHHDGNPKRTSPVMKVYDMLVALNKKTTSTTLDLDASKCTSDWFYTKRDMHFENVGVKEYVSDIEEDAFDKTDIPTDCETDATDFETFEDNESADVFISLQALMAKYFENNPIVNMIKPLHDIQDDVSKTPIKRKSVAQHEHICKVTKTSTQSCENSETKMIAEGNFNVVIDGTQTKANGSETDGKFEENLIPDETIQNITPQTSPFKEEAMHIRASQNAAVLTEGREFSDNASITINTAETLEDVPFSPSLVGNMPKITYCKESESDKISSSLVRVEIVTASSSKETAKIQEKETEISKDECDYFISNNTAYNECHNTVLPHEFENSTAQEQEDVQSLSGVAMEISESSNQPLEMVMSDISANYVRHASHVVEIKKDCLTSRTPTVVESLKLKVLKVINEQCPMNVTLVPETTECATEYETMNNLFTTYTTDIKISLPNLVEEPKTLHQRTKNTLEKVVEEAVASENKASLELREHKPSVTRQETPDLPELAEFSPSTIESVDEVIQTPLPSEKSHEIIDLEKSPNILDPTNDQPLSVVELPELLITVPIDSACNSSSNALVTESLESSFSEIVLSDASVHDIPENEMMLSFDPEQQTDTELNQTDKLTVAHVTHTNSVQSPEPYPEQSGTDISEIVQCSLGSRIATDADNSNLGDVTELDFGSITEGMDIKADKFLENNVKDQESIARAVKQRDLKSCVAVDPNNPPEDTELKQEIVKKSVSIDKTVCLDTESNIFLNDSALNEETTLTEMKPCIESVAENDILHAEIEKKAVSILGPVNESESINMETDKLLEGTRDVAPDLKITLLNNHSSLRLHEKMLTDDSIGKTEIHNGTRDIEVETQNIAKHEEASENILQISSANKRMAIENQQDDKTLIDGLEHETEVISETLNIRSAQCLKDYVENRERLGNELEPKNWTRVESRPEENTKPLQFIESEQGHTIIMNLPVENTGLSDNLIDDTDTENKKCLDGLEAANEAPADNVFKIALPQKTTPIETQPEEITLTDNLIKETKAANEDILKKIPVLVLMKKPAEEKLTEMAPVETQHQVCSKITTAVEQSSDKYKTENFTLANIDTKPDSVHNISEGSKSMPINNNLENETAIRNQSPTDIKQLLDGNQRDDESPTGVAILERLTAEDNVKHKDLSIEVDNNFYKKPKIEGDIRLPVNITSFEENIENCNAKFLVDTSQENICDTLATAEARPSQKQQTFVLKGILDEKFQVSALPSSVSNTARSSCIEDISESNHSNENWKTNQDYVCRETVIGNVYRNKLSEVDIPSEVGTYITAAKNNVSDWFHPVSKLISTEMYDNNNTKSVPSEVNVQEAMQYQLPSFQRSSQEVDPENQECETEVITEEILDDNSEMPNEVNIPEMVYKQSPSRQSSSQEINSETLECETEIVTEEILNDNSVTPSQVNIQEVVHNQSPSHQILSQEINSETLECETEVVTEEILNDNSETPSEVNIQEVVHNQSPSHQFSSQKINSETLECETEVVTEEILNDNSETPSEVNIQEMVHNQSPSHQCSSQEIYSETLECETEVVTEEISNDNSEVPSEVNIQKVKIHIQSPSHQSSSQEIVPELLECEIEVVTEKNLNNNSETPSEVNIQEVVHNQSPSHQRSSQEINSETLNCETEVVTEEISNDDSEMPSEVNTQEMVHDHSPSHQGSSKEVDPEIVEYENEVVTEEILNVSSETSGEGNIQEVVHNHLPSHQGLSQKIDSEILECVTEVVTEEILNDSSETPSAVQHQGSSHKVPEILECEDEIVTVEILNDNSKTPSKVNIDPEIQECETEEILNDSSEVQGVIELPSPTSSSSGESSNIIAVKAFGEIECDESILEKNATLIYKDDSGVVLKGIEYNDPEIGPCYVFPLAKSSDVSEESELLNENGNSTIEVIQAMSSEVEMQSPERPESKTDLYDDKYLTCQQPKVTYIKRKLKRKSNMKDVITSEKRTRRNPRTAENIQLIIANRFRKGKKIDVPKLTAAAIARTSYAKEFKELMEHFDNIEFSYSISLGREFIDVPRLLQNWPIKGSVLEEFNNDQEIQNLLFVDTQKFEDPLEMSFVEEITADYNDANYPITADETDTNVGFGEGSGRVIQNLDGGAISNFSAATLSDVKQSQPFLLSEKSDDTDMVKFHQSSQQELLETIKRLSTYLDLKEKVRSFFKNTTIELTRTSKKEKDSINDEDTSAFPFHLYIPKIVEPRPLQTIVQVVQVGQLPVSAAAQNPVTCDPRVTQVSDASPSQCSVDNSPLDPQHESRTEYTELTTADLSMPLVEEYTQHNHSLPMDSQEGTKMTLSTENIPIQTELLKPGMKFVEIADENAEDKDKCTENSNQTDRTNRVVGDFIYDSNNTRTSVEAEIQALFERDKEETSEAIPDPKPQNGSVEKTDQIAHAMNAAGISTTPEPVPQLNRAQAFVNLLSQKIRQSAVVSSPNSPNSYPKTTTINAMSLQQALAQILPPPLNQTSSSDNNLQSQNTGTPQVLHIVQGKGGSGNQITLLDNSQQSVITSPNATPVLHIVQNKTGTPGATSNGSPAPQSNAFSGISLVDTGLQQGGNQLLHIVNTGNQKNNNASQLLKRVNLLTNLTNVQGSNEQKMVQFVCKSADGKSIQLNAPHQRSMVLRLQPIDPPNIQAVTSKPAENQQLSPTSSSAVNTAPTTNKTDTSTNQEIKSRSVYEENYAKFIQNSSTKSTVLEKLPKFNQAFGKSVYQDGSQKQNEIHTNNLPTVNTGTESTECPPAENTINLDHIGPINSPPLLLRKSPQTTQTPHTNLVQQIKQAIAPMNLQTMHGGVIYTRQIPVNIGGGQTINLITVPSTEIVDESGQKQQINQEGVEPSIIKIVPQSQPQTTITEGTAVNDENAQQNPPQPQPVLTQMRIKLPMLSKNPQMVSGARVVRPSFFQIQRNIVGGTNQQVFQQLVLTAAPPLGQQTIRLPQTQTRQIKIPDNQSPSESQMSTSTLEQLREFDMVLEQVKERSTGQPNSNSNSSFKLHNPSTDTTDSPPSATSTSTAETTQVLYSIGSNQPINVAYVNRKTTVTTPTTSTFVRSPDSSGIADSPTSSSSQAPLPQAETSAESSSTGSTSQPKVKISSRQRPRPKPHQQNTVKVTPPPKPSAQKPLEDEQTTQRILYILAEYKEQVENSPDKDKPAPRRRNNPPTNPSGSSKRKKSSSGSRRPGRDLSPIHGDDMCRTMGSEDSSCGTSQGDCNESCIDSHSPQDSPQKVSRKLTFEPEPGLTPTSKPQPQRNVIVADGQTITVARGTPGKPATAVLMPANYILPVSMVKGGQQIAIVTNRGPKLLTVGGGEGGATTNALLLQRLIGPAGLKPVLARPGVRHVRLPSAALHNLQAFNLATASNTQPPDSTASPASDQNPPDLVESNRTETSPWTDRSSNKPDRVSSPDETEPWNLPSSADPHDYSYEETVRAENMDRTVLDQIQDRYSPDMEAQRIFDKMFDVEKKSYTVDSVDSPRCGYDIDASDCDDKPYQVVHKKDTTARQGRFAHVSAAALRHKYAILEHELRLQKSLSEECEDLGVDSPSASELFPEAELLFAASPAQDHATEAPHHSHTPQPTLINQSAIQPDIDDQIATDHLLQQRDDNANDRQDLDVNLGLEDVGIVTVSQDGMQATIALDQEEFARSHPNTTFHSEPTDASEVQPFTISGLKSRPVTSTIFHSNRPSATVLMTAPQATVISQTTTEQTQHNVKYSELDNMIHTLPSTHTNNMNLPSVLVKDDGLTRFDNILTESRELHLSNTASAIVHSSGNATQVIRRVGYDDNKRARDSFLMDEPDPIIAGDDAKMVAEDSSRDATLESMGGDVDDDNSSPGRNAELFWESNSASERSESRRPLDFSSDSEKCCKSPSYDETNSTDSSGIGAHMRLDSVIKDARGIDRSGSADGSSADDTHPPLRTYPPKRLFHTTEGDAERSLSGKTRAGERSPDTEVKRRASGRGVVKRGCHCCNGSPAPPKPKKPRQRKSTSDFTH